MIYNSASIEFKDWLGKLKTIAEDEYDTEIPWMELESDIFFTYYCQGMDIHEALSTYNGLPFQK